MSHQQNMDTSRYTFIQRSLCSISMHIFDNGRPVKSKDQSAKMLIFQQNGEERLITFKFPEVRCTLQEVLKQCNIPFTNDTYIQCVQNCSSEIDYFVAVGTTKRIEVLIKNHPLISGDICNTSLPTEPILVSESQRSQSPEPPCNMGGKQVVCKSCGYKSYSFSQCSDSSQQCKVKRQRPMQRVLPMRPPEKTLALEPVRLLIFLHNIEHRFITYMLPKKSCTLYEVLRDCLIPFTKESWVQCMQKNNSEIDYFISIDAANKIEDDLKNHPMLTVCKSCGYITYNSSCCHRKSNQQNQVKSKEQERPVQRVPPMRQQSNHLTA